MGVVKLLRKGKGMSVTKVTRYQTSDDRMFDTQAAAKYQTSDDRMFDTQAAAKLHEYTLCFKAYVEKHAYYGATGISCADDMVEWLEVNDKAVHSYLTDVLAYLEEHTDD